MVQHTADSDDAPVARPRPDRYEPYRFETTTNGDALIYDVDRSDCWIQADETLSLDEWV